MMFLVDVREIADKFADDAITTSSAVAAPAVSSGLSIPNDILVGLMILGMLIGRFIIEWAWHKFRAARQACRAAYLAKHKGKSRKLGR